jgi:hypothetical protein
MSTLPASIFKYVPPDRVDIILNERIAFTPPNRFKDEFDVRPRVKPVIDRQFLRKPAKKAEQEFLKSLPRNQRPRNKRQRRDIFRKLRLEAVENVRRQAPQIAANWEESLPQEISAKFGILCMSEVADENLIWKESADHHRGFAIEFDLEHSSFQAMGQLKQVEYVLQRPIYDPVEGAKGFWLQKLKERYKHEREWRISRQLDQCEVNLVNGETIYLCPLSRVSIKAIYLGLHSDKQLENRIREALAGMDVKFNRAYLEKGTSNLSFQEL